MSVIKASLYRNVLSWRLKVTLEWTQRSGGSGTTVGVCSMHQKGPAAANYRSPNDDIVHDTTTVLDAADRRPSLAVARRDQVHQVGWCSGQPTYTAGTQRAA